MVETQPSAAAPILFESCFFKATPKLEGGQRVLYCEPSNEATDMEGERVLREALRDSKDYFLAKGNFDIEHLSLIGLARGIPKPRLYEIGRPTDVKIDDRVFVKGVIYQGEGETAQQANMFWESLTQLSPPMAWYPSVGGHVRESGSILPKGAQAPVKAIQKVYWNNIGFAREPINPTVPQASLMPMGAFAKCYIGSGSTLQYDVVKSIEAGYGSDHAALSGGGALRHESLHGKDHFHGRANRLIRAIKSGQFPQGLTPSGIHTYLIDQEGMDSEEADIFLKQFWQTIHRSRQHTVGMSH